MNVRPFLLATHARLSQMTPAARLTRVVLDRDNLAYLGEFGGTYGARLRDVTTQHGDRNAHRAHLRALIREPAIYGWFTGIPSDLDGI